MTNNKTKKFQDKKNEIINEASRIFNARGVKATRISDIATEIGLLTNSLTYYFPKKEDLVAACILRSADAISTLLDDSRQHETLEARIRDFVERYATLLADIASGHHAELIVFSDVLNVMPPHASAVTNAYNQMFRKCRQLLQAPNGPNISAKELNARAHLLLASMLWARTWIRRYEPSDYHTIAGRLADIMVHGLVADQFSQVPLSYTLQVSFEPSANDEASAAGDAYLKAATRLVNRHGYQGTSVEMIAAELKLTKGSFYHHHETKEQLIAACFERTFSVLRYILGESIEKPGNGLHRLATACFGLLAYQTSEHGPLLRFTAWTGLPDPIRNNARRTMERLGERFSILIVDGMLDGSIRIVDATVAAQFINGLTNAASTLDRWVPGCNQSEVLSFLGRPALYGLCAAPAPAPDTAGIHI